MRMRIWGQWGEGLEGTGMGNGDMGAWVWGRWIEVSVGSRKMRIWGHRGGGTKEALGTSGGGAVWGHRMEILGKVGDIRGGPDSIPPPQSCHQSSPQGGLLCPLRCRPPAGAQSCASTGAMGPTLCSPTAAARRCARTAALSSTTPSWSPTGRHPMKRGWNPLRWGWELVI